MHTNIFIAVILGFSFLAMLLKDLAKSWNSPFVSRSTVASKFSFPVSLVPVMRRYSGFEMDLEITNPIHQAPGKLCSHFQSLTGFLPT